MQFIMTIFNIDDIFVGQRASLPVSGLAERLHQHLELVERSRWVK